LRLPRVLAGNRRRIPFSSGIKGIRVFGGVVHHLLGGEKSFKKPLDVFFGFLFQTGRHIGDSSSRVQPKISVKAGLRLD
jgi:hypothetical protein